MGLIKTSIFILIATLAVPVAFRTLAPESWKAQFNAYVSQHKNVDHVIRRASAYFDQTLEHADPNTVRKFVDDVKIKLLGLLGRSQPKQVTCKGEPANLLLMSKDELAKYDGSAASNGLYLAFLGQIYDVAKNKKHYEPGGDYSFFAAKDATRAFLTGQFQESELTDSLENIPSTDFTDVDHWVKFYENEYPLVGRLIGNFYDDQGCPTEILKKVRDAMNGVKQAEVERKIEDYQFPECNSEWNGDTKETAVWCSKMSGGIERDWVGVPRKFYSADSKSFRCVCARDSGPPSSGTDTGANNGDLGHQRLRQYEGCNPKENKCVVS